MTVLLVQVHDISAALEIVSDSHRVRAVVEFNETSLSVKGVEENCAEVLTELVEEYRVEVLIEVGENLVGLLVETVSASLGVLVII